MPARIGLPPSISPNTQLGERKKEGRVSKRKEGGYIRIRVARHNIPHTPNVDGRRVTLQLQQKLWWTVPTRDNEAGVITPTLAIAAAGLRHLALVVAGQPEIGNLEDAAVVDEEVGSLHVAVQDVVLVKIPQALEQLHQVALDLGFRELYRRVLEQS